MRVSTVVSIFILTFNSTASANFLNNCLTKDYLVTSPVNVGSTPKGAAITKDGSTVYVANMYSRTQNPTVTLLDLETFSTSQIITPIGIPGYNYGEILGNIEVTMGPEGNYAYVTRASGNKKSEIAASGLVTAIDVHSQKIHGYFPLYSEKESQGPNGSKIIQLRPESPSSSEQIAYVANWFTNEQHISVLNLDKLVPLEKGEAPETYFNAFIKNIKLETRHPSSGKYAIAPRGIQFTPDGRYAVVAGYNSKTLFVVDAQEHKQIAELSRISFESRLNFRHFSYDAENDYLYISHMVGDRVSRVDFSLLIYETLQKYKENDYKTVFIKSDIWPKVQVPFANGETYIRTDLNYPNNHPYDSGNNPVSGPANPNTIVLHPNSRYLFVSNRMTYTNNYNKTPKDHLGKIDVIDTFSGEIICSLNAGRQSTALDISPDGSTLISSSFKEGTIHIYDSEKVIDDYETTILEGE